jgi:hypothetical protein
MKQIPPFDRYIPTDGTLRHPERPWWVAAHGPPFLMQTEQGTQTAQLGIWLRSDGMSAECDNYNAIPMPNEGLARVREVDNLEPLPMPPLLCKQVWWIDGDEVTLLRVNADGLAFGVMGMRIGAIQGADLMRKGALLIDGPHSPWAPASWVANNCPSDGPFWGYEEPPLQAQGDQSDA